MNIRRTAKTAPALTSKFTRLLREITDAGPGGRKLLPLSEVLDRRAIDRALTIGSKPVARLIELGLVERVPQHGLPQEALDLDSSDFLRFALRAGLIPEEIASKASASFDYSRILQNVARGNLAEVQSALFSRYVSPAAQKAFRASRFSTIAWFG